MLPRKQRRVVVITGAASGIGRATAQAFARRGDAVALAARRGEALDEVAETCERMGGAALAVPIDVTDPDAVENLAVRAERAFGPIDIWVNNAAVTQFGRFDETPPELFERVIETNLFGYANGARSALRRFRARNRGVLINVASVVVWHAQPYTAAYVASKHAIRALSECLRMELILDGLDGVKVSTVMPPSVDTPLFQEGANLTGRTPHPIPPVYSPDHVAEVIVDTARHPGREVPVGWVAQAARLQKSLLPRALSERMAARRVERKHFADQPAPRSRGNLFRPLDRYAATTGGWRRRQGGGLHLAPAAALAIGLAAGLAPRLR